MRVEEVQNNGTRYVVTRAMFGTTATAFDQGTPIYSLASKTVIAPFPRDFFGSPYSGSWSYPVALPDVRVASAELFVTNDQGNSGTCGIFLTHNDNCGLRTLSGGQYTMQVDGYLAVDDAAGPALVVEASHAVRDVYAVLGQAADAPVQLRLNVDGAAYCIVTFTPGMSTSNGANGFTLPPLIAGSKVTLSVLSVGQTYPGADLTVLIRL